MATPEPLVSPRLLALSQALDAGDTAALTTFWQELGAQGAPLIEPIEDAADHLLVTFLWRGDQSTEHVHIKGSFTTGDLSDNAFVQLRDSDLWFRSYRLRNDLRTTYVLSANNPIASWSELSSGEAFVAHWRQYWHRDPLNSKSYVLPKDPEESHPISEHPQSCLKLPNAPPQSYVTPRPDVAHGTLDFHRFQSSLLASERRIWIYTPPNYQPDGAPYPLLLMFDAWFYQHCLPTTVDNLLAEGRIPPLVAVLVDNPPASRARDLTCHPPFADFLITELLPWIRERHHVTGDAAQMFVGGVSLGGLAAAYVGWRHADVFGNVLSQSGSYWWAPEDDAESEWLTRQIAASERRKLHFYLDAGLQEDKNDAPYDYSPTQLVVNRHMRTVLQAKGYPVHYTEYNGGHDLSAFEGTLAEGILALLGHTRGL